MQIVDTKGMLCPAPLMATKQAIKNSAAGEQMEVHTDNQTAKENLVNYLTELKITPVCSQVQGIYQIRFEVPQAIDTQVEAADYCSATAKKEYVVAIKSDKMGEGDPELGAILMRAFVNTLGEAEVLPTHVVLYNSGVKVALAGGDTAPSLAKLEEQGVTIIVCGTCADFYDVKQKIGVGMISNMYKITQVLSQTGHIVYP